MSDSEKRTYVVFSREAKLYVVVRPQEQEGHQVMDFNEFLAIHGVRFQIHLTDDDRLLLDLVPHYTAGHDYFIPEDEE